jgi:hypothetical protein
MKLQDQRHPLHSKYSPYWKYFRDHYEGGPDYPQKPDPLPLGGGSSVAGSTATAKELYGGGRYLWRHPLESSDKFAHRLNQAAYIPIVGPVVDFYSATVGKAEQITIDQPGEFEPILDNLDLQGSSYLQVMDQARRNAAVAGHTFLLVDSTQATGPILTQADAQREGIRPYVVEILPEDMLNWRLAVDGQPLEVFYRVRREYAGSVLETADKAPADEWEYRWWDRVSWRTYRLVGEELLLQAEGTHALRVIPVVVLYHRRKHAWCGESLLKDSARLAQKCCNWVSWIDESFEGQMFALPVLTSRKTPGEVGVGVTTILHLDAAENEKFEYATPPTGPFEASWDAFYRMVALINNSMGLKPVPIDSAPAAESGVSKAWDFFSGVEKIATRMAMNEQEAAKSLMMLIGMWMGREFTGSIQYSTRYDLSSLTDDIANLIALQSAGAPLALRREGMRRISHKAYPSLAEAVRKEIETEIDAMGEPEPLDEEPEEEAMRRRAAA